MPWNRGKEEMDEQRTSIFVTDLLILFDILNYGKIFKEETLSGSFKKN